MSSPFSSEPVEEVRLSRAPLVRVLAQIRFPRLTSLTVSEDIANRIARALEDRYPIFNEGKEMIVTITPDGVSQQPGAGRNWQLQDADQDWQVTYGAEFVALHTSRYRDREDFLTQLEWVIERFAEASKPPRAERIGVRYLNRLEEADLGGISSYLRKEMLGGLAAPTEEYGASIVHSLNQTLFNLKSDLPGTTDSLQARWGLIPPGGVIDPTLSPVLARSFILDIDAFRSGFSEFSASAISECTFHLADRAYRFFRWSVTDLFMNNFGANE